MSTCRSLPLQGARVVVTRAKAQTGGIRGELASLGAEVLELPALEIRPVGQVEIDALLDRLPSYDWAIFTSANAVAVLLDRATPDHVQALRCTRVAAVGKSTARRLLERDVRVDLIPPAFVGESLVDEIVGRGIAGQRVLVPAADIARDTVAAGLRSAGAIVDVVPVYRTVKPDAADEEVASQLRAGHVDIVTFASPSAVRNTLELLDDGLPDEVRVATIGPVTSRQARDLGLRVDIEAIEHSIHGLVDAIMTYWLRLERRENDHE